MFGRKKGFIHWPKDGEEGALLTKQLLHSRGCRGYRYRIGVMRERERQREKGVANKAEKYSCFLWE